MKVVTVSGPASAGKTAVILHIAHIYMASGKKVGVAKFDCLTTEDTRPDNCCSTTASDLIPNN